MKTCLAITLLLLAPAGAKEDYALPSYIRSQLPPEEVARLDQERAAFYAEEDRQLAIVEAQLKHLRPAFHQGDFAGIDAAVERLDMPLLWHIATLAAFGDVPDYSTLSRSLGAAAASERCLEINRQALDYLRPRLASIPGHAKPIGDRVDYISGSLARDRNRVRLLTALGTIGSMECIQQLARFTNDTRCPEERFHDPDSGMPGPQRNGEVARYAMHVALGDASPIGQPACAYVDPGELLRLIGWWDSEAARPYREWNHEDHEPMPPPRKRAVSLRPSAAPIIRPEASMSFRLLSHWPLLVILTLAALAVLLGFTKLRR